MLQDAVKPSTSMAQVMVRLGLRIAGGSYLYLKRRIARLEIDTTHFLGQAANCGLRYKGGSPKQPWQEILILHDQNAEPVRAPRRRRALRDSGREYKCEICGQLPVWNNKPLTLHVDHKNGWKWDDRPENLRFACPNCHSQTDNFGIKNRFAGVAELPDASASKADALAA